MLSGVGGYLTSCILDPDSVGVSVTSCNGHGHNDVTVGRSLRVSVWIAWCSTSGIVAVMETDQSPMVGADQTTHQHYGVAR